MTTSPEIESMIVVAVAFVVAGCVHEEGHWLAARLLRYPARFVLTRHGPGVQWGSDDRISTRRHRIIVTAAGPAANLLFAVEAAGMGWNTIAAVSFVFGCIQLLPFGPSDGHHLLTALKGGAA
jgi:hypothetical protein